MGRGLSQLQRDILTMSLDIRSKREHPINVSYRVLVDYRDIQDPAKCEKARQIVQKINPTDTLLHILSSAFWIVQDGFTKYGDAELIAKFAQREGFVAWVSATFSESKGWPHPDNTIAWIVDRFYLDKIALYDEQNNREIPDKHKYSAAYAAVSRAVSRLEERHLIEKARVLLQRSSIYLTQEGIDLAQWLTVKPGAI